MHDMKVIYNFARNNRANLEESELCGCFYCYAIFSSNLINDWIVTGEENALCPYCGIDSLLPDNQINLSKELLIDVGKQAFSIPK